LAIALVVETGSGFIVGRFEDLHIVEALLGLLRDVAVLAIVAAFWGVIDVQICIVLNFDISQILGDRCNQRWFSILHFLGFHSHAVVEVILVQGHFVAKMIRLRDTLMGTLVGEPFLIIFGFKSDPA